MLNNKFVKSSLLAAALLVPITALTFLVGGPRNSVQSAAPPLYVGSVNIPAAGSLTVLGISPTAAPSSCLGLSPGGVTVYYTCPAAATVSSVTAASGGNLTISPTIGAVVAAVASPTATSAPSSCAGWSATFALQSFTCVSTAGLISSLSGAGNLSGGGAGPTPAAIVLSSPSATACPSSVAGWSATFGLTYTNGCPAIVNQSKAAFTITVLPTATTLATPAAGEYTRAFMVSLDMVNPTVDGQFGYCDTAGSGGSALTFQFYESFGATPVFSTALPIATTVAWASNTAIGGGATYPATALPTSTTPGNPTWVYAVVKGAPTVPPSGACSFELHGLQRIIQ